MSIHVLGYFLTLLFDPFLVFHSEIQSNDLHTTKRAVFGYHETTFSVKTKCTERNIKNMGLTFGGKASK